MSKLVQGFHAVLFSDHVTDIKTVAHEDGTKTAWVPSGSQAIIQTLKDTVDNDRLSALVDEMAACHPAYTFRVYDDLVEYRVRCCDGYTIDEGVLTD